MSIGARIRRYRNDVDMTQRELAEEVGLTESAIRNYERDIRTPGEPADREDRGSAGRVSRLDSRGGRERRKGRARGFVQVRAGARVEAGRHRCGRRRRPGPVEAGLAEGRAGR
ncbi:MAG: helix-turn-helix domain-containing protein [Olsenella sp.]|nr:helix-turn-helix domain-containing protein [Olsenella sp.]